MNSDVLSFNVAIVGASGVGKSAYVVRHRSGDFVKQHNQSDQSRGTIYYNSTVGTIQVNHRTSCDPSIVTNKTDAVMVMFSVTDRGSFKYAIDVLGAITSKYPGLPVVLVANKVDVIKRKVRAREIRPKYHGVKAQYYEFSVKSNYNFEKPILHLLRGNLGIPTLQFVENEAIEAPEVHITDELARKLENEMNMEKVWAEISKAIDTSLDYEDDLQTEVVSEVEDGIVDNEIMESYMLHKEMSSTFTPFTMGCRL